jgi:hypothetical protein
MKRLPLAVILTVIGAGCEPGNDSGKVRECFSIQDCPSGSVCFLGACVDPNYSITSVYAEMTPPASSSFLQQAVKDPFDLNQGVLEMSLRASVLVSGALAAEDIHTATFCESGTLKATAASGIPGREVVRQSAVSFSTFDLSVVPGDYALSFASNQGGPPLDFPSQSFIDDSVWQQTYPSESRWVKVHGRVRYTAEAGNNVLGALVTGTAAGAGGLELRSTSTLTDSSGGYLISFPPGAEVFCVAIGPGTNLLVPETTKCGLTLAAADGYVDDIILGVLNKVTVAAVVKDANGQPVSRANVMFEGVVGDGLFSTRADTTEQGDVKQGDPKHNPELWPGEYTVTVAPNKTDPWALTTASLTITSGEPLTLYVGQKVQLSGTVLAYDGTPVPGASLTVTRQRVRLFREFTTATASDGTYALAIDPGDEEADAEYELAVQPDVRSRLPYYRERFRVGTSEMVRDVHLYDATLAAGRVQDPGGAPLAEVIIGFYSMELSSTPQALPVGIGRTNGLGEFVVPLPQPNAQ